MNKEAMWIVAISEPPKRTTGIQCRKNGRRGGGGRKSEDQLIADSNKEKSSCGSSRKMIFFDIVIDKEIKAILSCTREQEVFHRLCVSLW